MGEKTRKNVRAWKIFFVVAFLFFTFFGAWSFSDLAEMKAYEDGEPLVTMEGVIDQYEQWDGDDFYYFTLKEYGETEFRLLYTEVFPFEKIEQLQKSGAVITVQVPEKDLEENMDEGLLDIVSFDGGADASFELEEYIAAGKRDAYLGIGLCTVLLVGSIFSYFYIGYEARKIERINRIPGLIRD